jgi:hypothetical protein
MAEADDAEEASVAVSTEPTAASSADPSLTLMVGVEDAAAALTLALAAVVTRVSMPESTVEPVYGVSWLALEVMA